MIPPLVSPLVTCMILLLLQETKSENVEDVGVVVKDFVNEPSVSVTTCRELNVF